MITRHKHEMRSTITLQHLNLNNTFYLQIDTLYSHRNVFIDPLNSILIDRNVMDNQRWQHSEQLIMNCQKVSGGEDGTCYPSITLWYTVELSRFTALDTEPRRETPQTTTCWVYFRITFPSPCFTNRLRSYCQSQKYS